MTKPTLDIFFVFTSQYQSLRIHAMTVHLATMGERLTYSCANISSTPLARNPHAVD